jgi:cell division protein FtsW (lipid II flippase)
MARVITAPEPTPEHLIRVGRFYRRQALWYALLSAAFFVVGGLELARHREPYFSLCMGTLWLLVAVGLAFRASRFQRNLRGIQ